MKKVTLYDIVHHDEVLLKFLPFAQIVIDFAEKHLGGDKMNTWEVPDRMVQLYSKICSQLMIGIKYGDLLEWRKEFTKSLVRAQSYYSVAGHLAKRLSELNEKDDKIFKGPLRVLYVLSKFTGSGPDALLFKQD